MKNVCFFISVKFWGGGTKLHLEYALEFKKKGYNVFLAGDKDGLIIEEAKKHDLDVFYISGGNRAFLNPMKLNKFVNFYKKNAIDTVIFSNSEDVKLAGISAKIAKVKNVVYLRGLAKNIKNSFSNRFLFSKVLTHIVANSEETKKTILKNLHEFLNENKVRVIYHGIDVNDVNYDRKLKEIVPEQGKIILGNAGRITEQKGHDKLIEIAKILKENKLDFTLYLAGVGEMEDEIRTLITQYGLEKEVIMLGFVNDMEAFMNSIDVFLLTSLWEGFGYVIVEAMIKSKPVVAFNMTSNPEIISQNQTGYLVDYPNISTFAEKVKLLSEDDLLRRNMGESAKQSIINRFNLEERITEFEQYLLE
ncbi:glycosyltransferase [Tenacibaculum jejuense]|uniref:Glycosyl transferase, group 1 family protein n=1 Tax=Tenacibaculum jejuense TaxID=584609 RepID=A0A238U901_9FLAO|nr:glycosyltransferase [Tenacibaculum jejuense]SNR15669.1 Glycosyl transferase, group 1 family protein [Tenacibaculum jejuense]